MNALNDEVINRLRELNWLYGRLPEQNEEKPEE